MANTGFSLQAEAAISRLNKGLGEAEVALDAKALAGKNWNLLREDLSLPAAVLDQDRVLHNLAWMKRFIEGYGVKLAPHGKTTMAPKLFKMQLDSGAWGITLATAHQTVVAHAHGVRRVLMANELVGKQNMAMIARLLCDEGFEFYCLVDSAEQVRQLGAFFSAAGLQLNVLLELGVMGGRAGVRDDAQMQEVMVALTQCGTTIRLCGVELYEGVLDNEPAIRAFLDRGVKVMRNLMSAKAIKKTPAILTGAGSAWYDVVADVFTKAGLGSDVEIVLRPGCYLTHDVGSYKKAQARILDANSIAQEMHANLLPALQIWAYVQSIPEPEKAIVGMGKRDAAFDSGLPVPVKLFRPGRAAPQAAPYHWAVTKMMDQHAFLQIAAGDDVRVGDMISFDICHPCLTFDKWRVLPLVDAQYQVVDWVQTYF